MIYAIGAVGTEYIKFGYAQNVQKRLNQLQTACPMDLCLLASCKGSQRTEHGIHARLIAAKAHHRGEWFRNCAETQSIIENMKDRSLQATLDAAKAELMHQNRHRRLGAVLELSARKSMEWDRPTLPKQPRTTRLTERLEKQMLADPFPRMRARGLGVDLTNADIHAAVSSWFEQKHRSNASITQVKS